MPAPLEIVCDTTCDLGEGPVWHTDEQWLYWVDIVAGRLWRYDPGAGGAECVHEGRPIGGFTIQADGALLLFRDQGRIEVWREGTAPETVIDGLPGEEETRFNDVGADPEGRVFCGTLGEGGMGRLYRLERDGSIHKVFDEVGCSNGIGFSPDRRPMYYAESKARTVWRFDYDAPSGGLSARRPFAQTAEGEVPDGLTVDAAGDVWVALWDAGAVARFAPDGSLKERTALPARRITSAAFGGADLADLYVTSAAVGAPRDAADPTNARAGALFRLPGAGRGRAERRSRIALAD